MKYKRVLLKLSGESLMGNKSYGIDPKMLHQFTMEIKSIVDLGVQVAVVIGGGNIYRGLQAAGEGMDRVQGDYMGMMATVINSIALQGELEKNNIKCKLLGGLRVEPISELMSRKKAQEYLKNNNVVIISGGTGNPYFTTDTASALRAVEVEADILLKGTRVDGVYSDDPEKNPKAIKYKSISFDEAYEKNLKVMDLTSFTLCRENNMPIYVFDMNTIGNLKKVILGEDIGTIVSVKI